MRYLIFAFILFGLQNAYAQQTNINSLKPAEDAENIEVKKLFGDKHSSSFVIWVKESVRLHKHEYHSEHVYVLEGSGKMVLGDKTLSISAGAMIFIPEGTPHSVEVTSDEALKVISIQAPEFTGEDRVFLD